jgi:hypothetical protein
MTVLTKFLIERHECNLKEKPKLRICQRWTCEILYEFFNKIRYHPEIVRAKEEGLVTYKFKDKEIEDNTLFLLRDFVYTVPCFVLQINGTRVLFDVYGYNRLVTNKRDITILMDARTLKSTVFNKTEYALNFRIAYYEGKWVMCMEPTVAFPSTRNMENWDTFKCIRHIVDTTTNVVNETLDLVTA